MTSDPQSLAQRIDAISDDLQTPVGQLREMVAHFVAERDWHQFHAPKNISMALAVEAAELMEHFQWITVEASRSDIEADKRAAIGEEIADVICYAMALCNEMGFDVATLMREKMKKNVAKYPADKFKGRYGKDDPPK
ncbi:nucleotide pyrophosphohydrolase [Bremerella cremea]|uniref:NTP pyrophosphohydrolase n=1 Tax=Blastopirellula marina TaxID=124 RepID=A0A2S8FPN9_9BACT|nr:MULTISPECIES: nucleotide pyrophosphohydrolase [Pirellulaceae]PQO34149.1 NTP pyrophosphohydrolase [Blastopirellula marina]RCS46646.1 nucleotide pyrophosphohydrolase [Bremerella cremea]